MVDPKDGPEFDLAIDHVEERSTPRPLAGPVASIPPVSGDGEELEFDLLGATSQPTSSASLPSSQPRSEASSQPTWRPSAHPPAILPPPVISEAVQAGVEADEFLPPSLTMRGDEGFHPPSLRVPEFTPPNARGELRSPQASKAPLPVQLAVPDLAIPTRRSPTPSRAAPAQERSHFGPELAAGPRSQAPRAARAPAQPDMNMFGGTMLGDFELDEVMGPPEPSLRLGAGATEASDDGPWPTGISPERDAFDIPREKLEKMAGFPVAPGMALLDSFYFLAVRTAVKGLVPRLVSAEEKLGRLERARDDKLGEIADLFRTRLAREERFSSLYGELASFERVVSDCKAELISTDHAWGDQMKGLEARLLDAQQKATRQVQAVLDAEKVAQTLERNFARSKGLTSRLQIEMRNLARLAQDRAPTSSKMPPELGGRYTELETEFARASTDAANLEREYRSAKTRESDARDLLRKVEMDAGRIAAERDGLLAKQESRNAGMVESLQVAEEQMRLQRAETGRALLRLRSEVPVERSTRASLFERDEAVKQAALEAETLKRAATAYDAEAYQRGRVVLIAFVGVIVSALGWAVLR